MKEKKQWLYRWKNWLMPSAVPGVWNRKEGGHFVRTRVIDPTTGRMKEIKKVMPEADLGTAIVYRIPVSSGSVTPIYALAQNAGGTLGAGLLTGEADLMVLFVAS